MYRTYIFKVAEDLLKRKHELDGVSVTLSKRPKQSTSSTHHKLGEKDNNPPSLPPERPGASSGASSSQSLAMRTVIVEGIEPGTSEELLRLMFENVKRSGGGEIEELNYTEDRRANITFIDEDGELINRVLSPTDLFLCIQFAYSFQHFSNNLIIMSLILIFYYSIKYTYSGSPCDRKEYCEDG